MIESLLFDMAEAAIADENVEPSERQSLGEQGFGRVSMIAYVIKGLG